MAIVEMEERMLKLLWMETMDRDARMRRRYPENAVSGPAGGAGIPRNSGGMHVVLTLGDSLPTILVPARTHAAQDSLSTAWRATSHHDP